MFDTTRRALTLTILTLTACGPGSENGGDAPIVILNGDSMSAAENNGSAQNNGSAENGDPADNNTTGENNSGDTTSSPNNEPQPRCLGTEFADSASSWSLPPGYGPRAFFTTTIPRRDCNPEADRPGSATLDFDGDGLLDMLITQQCSDTDVGTTHWKLFRGDGTGFSSSSSRVDLPTGYSQRAFSTTTNPRRDCASGNNRPAVATLDITGDDLVDLVLTQDCNDTSIGTTKWRVFVGNGSGFDAPRDWSLPSGYGERSMFTTTNTRRNCNDGSDQPAISTLDFTGDGLVDLLVTQDCDDPEVGSSHWRLFRGTSAGFEDEHSRVDLPAGNYSERAFFTTTNARRNCSPGSNQPAIATLDITDDGYVDLVMTQQCDDPDVGTTKWLVYPGNGAQFGGAMEWPLPAGYSERSMFTTTNTRRDCATGTNQPAIATIDLSGDGAPDLVVTQDCTDADVGTSYWRLFENVGDGFAEDYSSVALPGGYSERAFFTPYNGRRNCGSGANQPAVATLDMTGDGLLDLVLTQDCDDDAVGTSSWSLFAATCTVTD